MKTKTLIGEIGEIVQKKKQLHRIFIPKKKIFLGGYIGVTVSVGWLVRPSEAIICPVNFSQTT